MKSDMKDFADHLLERTEVEFFKVMREAFSLPEINTLFEVLAEQSRKQSKEVERLVKSIIRSHPPKKRRKYLLKQILK